MKNESKIIIYNTPDGKSQVALFARDGNIWMNQKQMGELFGVNVSTVNEHLKNIYNSLEIDKEGTIRKFPIVQKEGNRNVKRNIDFYNLDAIIAVGYRVNSYKATKFRIWATDILKEYIIKGFAMDDDRLKNPNGRVDYFDELLARIRDIRASEKRFYQKLRDLFSLSSDYDKTDKSTHLFFAETQNKLLYAITGQTAAEIIVSRTDSSKLNMGLASWEGSIVRKEDIYIAKNYLTEKEIGLLNRLVTIFLETAEFRVIQEQDITIQFWRDNVDEILQSNKQRLLQGTGTVSRDIMREKVSDIYDDFNIKRKKYDAIQADNDDLEELKKLENKLKK